MRGLPASFLVCSLPLGGAFVRPAVPAVHVAGVRRSALSRVAEEPSRRGLVRPWGVAAKRGRVEHKLWASSTTFNAVVTPAANSSVTLSIEVPGTTTEECYNNVIRDLATRTNFKGYSAGKNKRVPPYLVVNHYGATSIKTKALETLAETAIKEAIAQSVSKPLGQAVLVSDPRTLVELYTPGEPLMVEVKVDVWPEVEWKGDYTNLHVEVEEAPFDQERYNAAMENLRERSVVLEDTPEGYEAQSGDSVIANMMPFEELPDGSKGAELPKIASGDEVEIVLSGERYMPGLTEGLIGAKAGDVREVRVKFPERMPPSAAALAGKKAVWEVSVSEVKRRNVPALDDAFANSIREGLTFAELEREVIAAINDEGEKKKQDNRNRALEMALLGVAELAVPETMIVEQAKNKFAIMMSEMREQGQNDAEVRKLVTKENFEKWLESTRPSTTRTVATGIVRTALAEKEGITVDPLEIEDQLELIRAEQKGQEFDENAARANVEATLLQEKVLNWLAERATITYRSAQPVPAPAS